jgi:hypothetical protein
VTKLGITNFENVAENFIERAKIFDFVLNKSCSIIQHWKKYGFEFFKSIELREI